MNILGIETSCDETAAAVVEDGRVILSNIVASSSKMHAKTGGIIPEQAARQQIKSIIPVIDRAIKKSGYNYQYIDALAVTTGPGLIGSLLVGVETAKTLAYVWDKPIVPVNHLVAHIYANWLTDELITDSRKTTPKFPAIALVVSGGHTDLVLMRGHPSTSSGHSEKIKWIGGTRDDAAGEAFDKTARLLGLPYPGGPSIAAEAAKIKNPPDGRAGQKSKIKLPRPMIDEKNFDFSFSGLKTAVLYNVKNLKNKKGLSSSVVQLISYETQEAITDVLVAKTLKAANIFKPKSLLLAGGVAANTRLREKFQLEIGNRKLKTNFYVPTPSLCTDNAAYIAGCAYFNYSPILWKKIGANPELTITSET